MSESVKQNLQFIRCRHPNACMTCAANGDCELQRLAFRYNVLECLPEQTHEERPNLHNLASHAVEADMSKCVLCTRCVRACSEIQGMDILGVVGRGAAERVSTIGDLPLAQTACISCGQVRARITCPSNLFFFWILFWVVCSARPCVRWARWWRSSMCTRCTSCSRATTRT